MNRLALVSLLHRFFSRRYDRVYILTYVVVEFSEEWLEAILSFPSEIDSIQIHSYEWCWQGPCEKTKFQTNGMNNAAGDSFLHNPPIHDDEDNLFSKSDGGFFPNRKYVRSYAQSNPPPLLVISRSQFLKKVSTRIKSN